MRIQVIKVEVEETPKYKMANVTYKNLTFNKTESRKIPSFKNPDVFNLLAKAVDGDTFEIETTKDGQYIQWVRCTKVEGGSSVSGASSPAAASGTTYKPSYETADERAKKQVYIVRQSSLGVAAGLLAVGAKNPPKPSEVIEMAKEFEAYVFGTDPIQELINMENDLPQISV